MEERALLLAVAVLAWASASVLASGGTASATGAGRLARRVRRHVLGLLGALSRTSVVAQLLGTRAWRLASRDLAAELGRRGEALDEETACALILASVALGSCLAGLAFSSVASSLVMVAVGMGCVPLYASWGDARRSQALAREMPAIFRTLSVAMGSGQTLPQAVEYVGTHETGPAGGEFAKASLRMHCGMAADEALGLLAQELDAPGVGLLSTALVISHRTGSPLRGLLLRSARLVERQGEFQRLLEVKTAQARLSVRIVCLLPVAMIALLSLISPDFQAGLATPTGMGCALMALCLDGLALLIIRRLLRGVL